MTEPHNQVSVSSEYQLSAGNTQHAFAVTFREWQKIQQMIIRLQPPDPTYQNAFIAACTVLVSDILFLLGIVGTGTWEDYPEIIKIIAFALLLSALLAMAITWKLQKDARDSLDDGKNDIIGEMDFIKESRVAEDESSANPASVGTEQVQEGLQLLTARLLEELPDHISRDEFTSLEFEATHVEGADHIRWVRFALTPDATHKRWAEQVYLSVNPEGRVNLWGSGGSKNFVSSYVGAGGLLETDTARLNLSESSYSVDGDTLRVRLSIQPRVVGKKLAILTVPDKELRGRLTQYVGRTEIG